MTRDSWTSALSAVFFDYPAETGTKAVGSARSYEATRALADRGPSRRIRHSIDGLEPGAVILVEIMDWGTGTPLKPGTSSAVPSTRTESRYPGADALRRFALTVPESDVLDLDVELAPWTVMSSSPSA